MPSHGKTRVDIPLFVDLTALYLTVEILLSLVLEQFANYWRSCLFHCTNCNFLNRIFTSKLLLFNGVYGKFGRISWHWPTFQCVYDVIGMFSGGLCTLYWPLWLPLYPCYIYSTYMDLGGWESTIWENI